MSNNKLIKLNDIASVVQGQSPESKYYSNYDGTPFMQGNRTFGDKYPTIDTYTSKVTKMAKENDVLMSVRAPVGDLNIATCDLCIGRGLSAITSKNGDNEFLYYSLKYNIQNLLRQGSGTTYSSVNKDIVNDFDLIVPSEENSWQYVSKLLSSLDEKIELNNQINKKLEAMAKTLYEYWFVQFDFPDENGQPYKSSGGQMEYKEELKREIPKGWDVKELKELIKIERGISYKSTDIHDGVGCPMINLNSFYLDGSYKPEGIKYFNNNYSENKVINSGDLIIATTDVTRNADIIGKAIIVPNIYEDDILLSCDIAKLVYDDSLDKYFLEKLFNSDFYHEYIKGFASGTLVLHLNTDGIGWYKTFIPPKDLLNKFSNIMNPIQKKKELVVLENQELVKLRDWLLPMLMNGQVRVK